MWKSVEEVFKGYPAQRKVALFLMEKGLQVKENGRIACDGAELSSTSLAMRLDVDRRVIDSTARKILEKDDLRRFYTNLKSIASLRDVAPDLGLGVVSISVQDAKKPGIIERITDCISRQGVIIRQAIADDPYFVDDPRFTVITDKSVRGELVEELKNIEGVSEITVI